MLSRIWRWALLCGFPVSLFAHCCSGPGDCEETPGYNALTALVSGLIGLIASFLPQMGAGAQTTALPGIPVSPPISGHPMYLPPESPGSGTSSVPPSPVTEDIPISVDEAAEYVAALYAAIGVVAAIVAAGVVAPAVAAQLTEWLASARAALAAYWAAKQSGALESGVVQTLLSDIGCRLNALQKLMAMKEAGLRAVPQTMEELRAVLNHSWTQLSGADRIGAIQRLAGQFPQDVYNRALELARQERPLNEVMQVLGIGH